MTVPASRELVALCDSIRSLYNVGSIFRTADAFGVSHLYLAGFTGTPRDELTKARIRKTALGAEETVAWTHAADIVETIKALQQDGYAVLALEQTPQARNLLTLNLSAKKLAIIFGHEVFGVSERALAAANTHVMIPMLGQKESLNVASAAAVALATLRWR